MALTHLKPTSFHTLHLRAKIFILQVLLCYNILGGTYILKFYQKSEYYLFWLEWVQWSFPKNKQCNIGYITSYFNGDTSTVLLHSQYGRDTSSSSSSEFKIKTAEFLTPHLFKFTIYIPVEFSFIRVAQHFWKLSTIQSCFFSQKESFSILYILQSLMYYQFLWLVSSCLL